MCARAAWLLRKACSFGEDGVAQLHPVPAPLFPQQNRGQLRARGTWTRKLLRLKNNCLCRVIFQADQFPEFVHHTAAQTAVEMRTGTRTGISTQMGDAGQVSTMARRRDCSFLRYPQSSSTVVRPLSGSGDRLGSLQKIQALLLGKRKMPSRFLSFILLFL